MIHCVINRASFEHAQLLTELAIAAKRHWKYPEKWIELWIPTLTISASYIAQYETWMAIVNSRPAGFYSLKPDEYPDVLWLDNLWVLPEFMRQGIGRELFQHALERSRARNVSILKIEADPNAVSFYERMGAHKIGERKTQVDGEPRILPIMELNL